MMFDATATTPARSSLLRRGGICGATLWMATLLLGVPTAGCRGGPEASPPAVDNASPPAVAAAISPPQPAAAEDTPPADALAGPGAEGEVELELDRGHCTLRASDGQVTAECTGGTLTCAELTRGDLIDGPGQEVVSRCDELGVLVVAGGNAVRWTLSLSYMESEEQFEYYCSLSPNTTTVSLVDAAADGTSELLVQATDCYTAGRMADIDVLWKWRDGPDGSMEPVASAALECSFTGDTSDGNAPAPPIDETWVCSGAYLEVGGAAGRGAVARLQDTPEGVWVSGKRDAHNRIRTGSKAPARTLRWDAAAFRFVGD